MERLRSGRPDTVTEGLCPSFEQFIRARCDILSISNHFRIMHMRPHFLKKGWRGSQMEQYSNMLSKGHVAFRSAALTTQSSTQGLLLVRLKASSCRCG